MQIALVGRFHFILLIMCEQAFQPLLLVSPILPMLLPAKQWEMVASGGIP